MLKPLIGVLLLAASTGVFAEPVDCSKAKDPARCEERVAKFKAAHSSAAKACLERTAKMKAAHGKAEKACAGKQGDARRDCMRHEMCAQAKDPAQCEARAKEAHERRQQKK